MTAEVIVRVEKSRRVVQGHPWVMSGAVQRVAGSPEPGGVVRVRTGDNTVIGWGHYSPESQIRVRMLSMDPSRMPEDDWLEETIRGAVARRRHLLDQPDLSACRLVYGESDHLPGCVVDRLGDYLVLQANTVGMDRLKYRIAEILSGLLHPAGIYEKGHDSNRQLEGLPESRGVLSGREPPPVMEIMERDCRFLVDIAGGQKTGYYIDQRENRGAVAYHAPGKRVLDAFSYTGAFACCCLRTGASATVRMDMSSDALALGAENLELNSLDTGRDASVRVNVFRELRALQERNEQFDLVILDPPKLAPTRRQLNKAGRAYKDLNMQAMRLLNPEGILATFSCSGAVTADSLQEYVRWAALDAKRDLQILSVLGQPEDHPVLISFPESAYLKGLICRVI